MSSGANAVLLVVIFQVYTSCIVSRVLRVAVEAQSLWRYHLRSRGLNCTRLL